MSELIVTMQMHVGANEAGDWANRRAGSTASTAWLRPVPACSPADANVLLRLHELRNAVEAMKQESFGPSLATSHSTRATLDYGNPAGYRGLHFLTRVND